MKDKNKDIHRWNVSFEKSIYAADETAASALMIQEILAGKVEPTIYPEDQEDHLMCQICRMCITCGRCPGHVLPLPEGGTA